MYKVVVVCLLSCCVRISLAQETPIKAVVHDFFQAMYRQDTAALRNFFVPAASLFTYSYDAKGNPRAKGESLSDFINGVSFLGDSPMEERLTGWQCMVDAGIASVWTPYEFYYEGKFSHCGVDSWQMMLVQGEWKITQLTDTRRKTNCPDEELTRFVIDSLINEWHHAAAISNAKAFFGFMTKDAVYIGTDSSERWHRDELAAWSGKYFERPSAWDFKPISRNITFSPGKDVAWFDELLDTWMGVCRSTGVVELVDQQWKLVHYQLSLTLPNEKLDDFRKLIGRE
jgi:ketosteroid isomerase-like protein